MIQSAITLRPARPTLDEGMAYARYLDVAAEGFFRFMLGRKATEIIAKAYIQSGSDYSYENVLFAEQNHRLVGMASGFTAEQQRTFSDQPLKQAAGSQVIRMMVVRILFASMIRILNMLDEGDFYLLSIATDEAVRGAGIGSALMDAMEERAVAGGSVRLALDVSACNAGARRLYERRGMAVESHWPRRLKIPRLKLYRMTKPLALPDTLH
ncbi:MAG: GNAT family N-acetyltransferase [Acidobacteriota bacterium]|nr:GNAT family N-acetyltransferase [Acidobacteriota bacterium]